MQTSAKRPAPEDLTSMIEQVNASGTPIVVGCKGGLQAAVISMEDLELIYSLKSGAFSNGRQDHPEPTALFDQSQRLAGLGYWEWDELADECKYCSPELARLHGVSVEDYMHDSTSTQADALWVHPDDRERYSRACHEFKQHGTRFDVSYRLLNPDGRIRYVKEIVNPVFGKKGDVVASFGFVQDLTEWFEKERELENAATLLQQASELANLGYWIWDEIEDKCVYCSATLAAMTETTVEEYLNDYATMSGLLKNIHPDDRQRYDDVIHDAKANKAMYEIDFR